MVILIVGSTHTGKTNLARCLMELKKYPYISIDHIKMGLVRSGLVSWQDNDIQMTKVLWPVVCEMIKTMVENEQNAIIEGCYIPHDWTKSFDEDYLEDIKCVYLIMSEQYIENSFDDIRKYASIIEDRGEDEGLSKDIIFKNNMYCYEMCEKYDQKYVLIDEKYDINELIKKVLEA